MKNEKYRVARSSGVALAWRSEKYEHGSEAIKSVK